MFECNLQWNLFIPVAIWNAKTKQKKKKAGIDELLRVDMSVF